MLIDSMKELLADTFNLYLKAHYYHWNVEGPDFKQYHDFFGDFYEEVYGSVDKIAEEIRALDAYAPGSFERYLELSNIKGEEMIIPAKEMLSRLDKDNNTYIMTLEKTYKFADLENELGLANFIQDRIDAHKKHKWMFKAFLKG